MAELPRYRPLGARIGSMPSVDFVQTGRAQASVYSEIVSGLDSMAKYMYEKEAAEAQAAGIRYGAENAPTPEQLAEAKQSGRDPAGLIPGDDSVFGRAARKQAMSIVQTEMEISAREAITKLRIDAKKSNITADEFKTQLNGIIDGYGSALADIDPAASTSFRASVAAIANSNLLDYAGEQAKRVEAEQRIRVQDDFTNNILPQIDQAINNGMYTDVFGRAHTPDGLISTLREKTVDTLAGLADEAMANRILDQFDKRVITAKTTYLTNWAIDDPRVRSRELRTEEFTDPNVATLWNSLDETQQAAARDAVRKAETEANNIILNRDRIDEMRRRDRVNALIPIINDGLRRGEDMSEQIAEMTRLDPERAEKMIDVRDTKGGVNDANTIRVLDLLALRGELTEDAVIDAVTDRKLTVTTAQDYYDRLSKQQDKRYTSAQKILGGFYGNPQTIMIGRALQADEQRRLDELNGHLQTIINRMDEDPDFNPLDYANDIVNKGRGSAARAKEIDELRTDINKRLDRFEALSGIRDTELLINEAQNMVNEEYVAGTLFTEGKGLPKPQRLQLMDIIKQLKQLQKLEAMQ